MSKKWLIVYTSLALSACGTDRPVLTLPPIEREGAVKAAVTAALAGF
jgi:hypothetical protein